VVAAPPVGSDREAGGGDGGGGAHDGRVAREQTVARYRAVYSACLDRNKTNEGIVSYLRFVGVRGRELRKANRYFPDQPDCKTYTRTLLGRRAPPGAFDVPELIRARTRKPSG
jgi:hypothetical protein